MELGAVLLRSRQGSDPGCQGSPSCKAPPLPLSARMAEETHSLVRGPAGTGWWLEEAPPAAAAGPGQ